MKKQPTVQYYLFELGNSVVKRNGVCWYIRDDIEHIWKADQSWMRRFYDAQYDVVEIDYDEESETIKDCHMIQGYWSEWATEQVKNFKK